MEWGGWSYLQVLLRGLGRIAREADPDWALVLSGQDYPLVHHTELEAFLARAASTTRTCRTCGSSGRCALSGEPRDEFVLRYGYRHFARAAAAAAPAPAPRLRPPPARRPAAARRARPAPGRAAAARLGRLAHAQPPRAARRARLPRAPAEAHAPLPAQLRRLGVLLRHGAGERPRPVGRRRARTATSTSPRERPTRARSTSADLPALESLRAHFARKFDPAVDAEVLDALDRLRAERRGRASLDRPWPAETSESP